MPVVLILLLKYTMRTDLVTEDMAAEYPHLLFQNNT